MKQLFSTSQIYDTIAALNQGFEALLANMRRLRLCGLQRDSVRSLTLKTLELRAWTNTEFIEVQQERELKAWARFGRMNRAREK